MKQEFEYLRAQWHGQLKILGGSKYLILGEQQHFVWDTTSYSSKWLDIVKVWGGHGPLVPPGYAYIRAVYITYM